MKRSQKALLVLPFILIPLLALIFHALGGGTTPPKQMAHDGFNTRLPSAKVVEKPTDKLAAYDRIKLDSAKATAPNPFVQPEDEQVSAINERLQQLNRQLTQPAPVQPIAKQDPVVDKQVEKLEKMMKAMQTTEDPEMARLNQMLGQIQQIKNPTIKKTDSAKAEPFKAIPAIIDGKQKVVDGAAVKLKLTDSVTLKDQKLAKGQLLFGICRVTNQRLLLTIENVRLGEQIIPVKLVTYSLDGMPGIPAPEAEFGTAAGNGADQTLQSMQFLSMDQSLATQAATGGINAAKSLLGKKVKKIKVKLTDQYPVLLKIER